MFAQVNDQVHRAQGGLGIGLALVKQLVVLHEGSIAVDSGGTGKGSSFIVRLPGLPDLNRKALSQDQLDVDEDPQHLRVLVVDDNVDVAETIGWLLEDMGHDFLLVHDARQALEVAHEFLPGIILLDIGMPFMDGHSVCRAFRQDEALKHIPIVAQTGWGQESDRAATTAAGFDYHLVKPIGMQELKRTLAMATRATAGALGLRAGA
jgi:CheY-like chemotaxis protein